MKCTDISTIQGIVLSKLLQKSGIMFLKKRNRCIFVCDAVIQNTVTYNLKEKQIIKHLTAFLIACSRFPHAAMILKTENVYMHKT